jgi:hypothetical protein
VSSGSFVGDDLLQALDAVLGEGGHATIADAVNVKAAVFGEHADRKLVQPVFVFAIANVISCPTPPACSSAPKSMLPGCENLMGGAGNRNDPCPLSLAAPSARRRGLRRKKFRRALVKLGQWTVEIFKRSDHAPALKSSPRR